MVSGKEINGLNKWLFIYCGQLVFFTTLVILLLVNGEKYVIRNATNVKH